MSEEEDILKENENKMKRLDNLIEDEIAEIGKYVQLKLSFGINIFSIQLPDTTIDLKKIILYIFNKSQRNPIDNIVLRQYLVSFPEFIDTLRLREQISDPKDLLLKLSQNLKKEEIRQDRVVFYNGQYGKSFYLILEGEVSVLLPVEFKLKLTDKQVFKYMYYLLEHKEYELIRLIFENNRHLLNDFDYRENTLYYKLKSYSERGLPMNVETEKINSKKYIQRYEYFANIEKIQREQATKKVQEEKKTKKNNKERNKITNNIFDIFIRENTRKHTFSSEKRFETKRYENDPDEEDIIKNQNFFYEEEETFSLFKYFEVIKLTKGKCFGELALTREGKKRNATIITTKDCIFGVLHKESYQAFIKETMDRARKVNVDLLLKCGLFRGFNSERFETNFFSCFKLIKKNKGEYLFKQGDKREFIYFLKKGEIQLELFCNCFYLEKIAHHLGYLDDNYEIKELTKTKKVAQFCKINRKFKVLILSDEVIGLEDHALYPERTRYAFSGLCSCYCEMFALDFKFFAKIMEEKIIKNNYIPLIKERKRRLGERLTQLKNNVIIQQYNIMIENTKYNNNAFRDNTMGLSQNSEKNDNIKFKTIYQDKSESKHKTLFINESNKKMEHKKTICNSKSICIYKNNNNYIGNVDTNNSNNNNKLNNIKVFDRSSSTKMNKLKYNESPKKTLKLKEEIINIKNTDIIFDKIKKNIRTNNYISTFQFNKNHISFPILSQNNMKSKKRKEDLNKFIKGGNIVIIKENDQKNSNKKLKRKNNHYVDFKNNKIPKILLRQSNIFNTEIDKINEIIINNYEKLNPSNSNKTRKKFRNLLINVPEFNKEDNQQTICGSNILSADSKIKYFSLPKFQNRNIDVKSVDEDDIDEIINYFEKNSKY